MSQPIQAITTGWCEHGKAHRARQRAYELNAYIAPVRLPLGAQLLSLPHNERGQRDNEHDLIFMLPTAGRIYKIPVFHFLRQQGFDPRQLAARVPKGFHVAGQPFPNARWRQLCELFERCELQEIQLPVFDMEFDEVGWQPPKVGKRERRKTRLAMDNIPCPYSELRRLHPFRKSVSSTKKRGIVSEDDNDIRPAKVFKLESTDVHNQPASATCLVKHESPAIQAMGKSETKESYRQACRPFKYTTLTINGIRTIRTVPPMSEKEGKAFSQNFMLSKEKRAGLS